jgi:hypothetical protein
MSKRIVLNDIGKELVLSKVTGIKLKKRKRSMIYLDEMSDGTWRLIYDENMIPDLSKIESIDILRD